MQPKSDELLTAGLKANKEEAFTEMYNRYYTRLHLEANYRLRNKAEAADVVHDVFAAIWKKRAQLPDQISLKGYLLCAVKNKCIDMQRKSIHFQYYTAQIDIKEAVYEKNPAILKEIATDIRLAIHSLPLAQREVVELVNSGFSHKEITLATGRSLQTIKNLLTTAKKTLRAKLNIIQHI